MTCLAVTSSLRTATQALHPPDNRCVRSTTARVFNAVRMLDRCFRRLAVRRHLFVLDPARERATVSVSPSWEQHGPLITQRLYGRESRQWCPIGYGLPFSARDVLTVVAAMDAQRSPAPRGAQRLRGREPRKWCSVGCGWPFSARDVPTVVAAVNGRRSTASRGLSIRNVSLLKRIAI